MPLDYRRTVEQLSSVASYFWPNDIAQQERDQSIIPILLETQEVFISILRVPVPDLEQLFNIVDASTMSANLFLKHLVILSDFGGEPLKRISASAQQLFPNDAMIFYWTTNNETEERIYQFKVFPKKKFSNSALRLEHDDLFKDQKLEDLQKDAIAVLLCGAAATNETVADILEKCELSDYLGQPEKLEKFIRQRYIWVSNITGGSKSNRLGQLAQNFVRSFLEDNLEIDGVKYSSNGRIPGIRHVGENDARLTSFDIVLQKDEKYVAVEVSFQFTTNSVIERKSGQAQTRYEQMKQKGYKIAYVLDGAGNFERVSALRTICTYSHCTVALSTHELDLLCQFIREYFTHG